MAKYWFTLYDPNDRKVGSYVVEGDRTLDDTILSWVLNHFDIEYIKITVNPPDES